MKRWLLATTIAAALLVGADVSARVEVKQFETPEQQARYEKMIDELRCLVCQNQNLADSNSELAIDMRRKTYEMVKEGKSSGEIADFMVERYGDFVLYRPPLNQTTLMLWVGPFLILVIGVTVLLRTITKRRAIDDSAVDRSRLETAAALLDADKRDQ
jgi:cytochrome c-type biogenesis protein CcmH